MMAALSGFLLLVTFSFAFSAPVDTKLQALTDTLSAIERLVRYYKSTYRDLNIDGLYGLRVLEAPVDTKLQALTDTLSAIERLVRYYKSTYRDLNIDGLYGLRVLEGQFGVLLEKFDKAGTGGLPNDIIARIRYLQVEATKISEEAVSFVKKGDEEYYKALHFVVGRPWKLWKNHRSLNFSSQWNRGVYLKNKERISESRSDRCMTQLTGSLGNRSTSCQVSEDCVQLMTARGLAGYGITHQILWTMLAEEAGCMHTINNLLKKQGSSLEDFQTEFCTNNFLEMIQTVHIVLKDKILPRFQDLFLEQQFICPNIGFHEFLSSTYLNQILTWQKESGCFGTMPRIGTKEDPDYEYEEDLKEGNIQKPSPANLKFVPQNHRNISKGGVVMQRGPKLVQQFSDQDSMKHNLMAPALGSQGYKAKPLEGSLLSFSSSKPFRNRKLMAEKALSGGCLAHKTAEAADALVMYLRYLIYPGQPNMFHNEAVIKSRVSRITPLTDNEDVAYALSMGQALGDLPKDMVEKSAVKKKENSVTANRTLLKKDYNQPNALNNNVLAAQLYGKNDKDDYYSNQKLKDDYYDDKNESPDYPRRDRKINPDQKMVLFDNGNQDKNNYADEDYKDDDYKDEEREEEDKNDERDNPYYDNNQRKQREEADRIEREDKDQYLNKQDNGDQINTAGPIEGGEKAVARGRSEGPSLGSAMLGFTVIFCVLLFFVYRFIRTRRVHIRYSLRSLMRL